MSFDSLSLPNAVQRWALVGPTGPHTDTLVAMLVGAGVTVECINAGTAYRLDGSAGLLSVLADQLQGHEGFALGPEAWPTAQIRTTTTLTLTHAYRRSVIVHGAGPACSWVARAIDRHLEAQPAGANRWRISGRTAGLVQWLAAMHDKPVAEVQKLYQIAPEAIAAEDAPVSVNVNLPTREITTDLMNRDDRGNLTKVIQTEKTI